MMETPTRLTNAQGTMLGTSPLRLTRFKLLTIRLASSFAKTAV